MRQQAIGGYIFFGTALRYLQDASEGQFLGGDGNIVHNIEMFLERLDELGLVVTAKAAEYEGLPGIQKDLSEAEDEALTGDQARHLRQVMTNLRTTLFAEADEKMAFVTSPKRWDVDRLLAEPGAMFGEGVFDLLDGQAATDFTEACKCIAYERPTAAVFHCMRGTESVLRAFYCGTVRQKRLEKDKQMWGAMVAALENRSKPPPRPLLDNLDAIRRNYRNPTQHPDANYTIDQSQDLLGLVIPAVNEMVALITKG